LTSYETEKNRKNQRPNRQNHLTTKREHLVLIRKYSPRSRHVWLDSLHATTTTT
jgi:hypothetical protein